MTNLFDVWYECLLPYFDVCYMMIRMRCDMMWMYVDICIDVCLGVVCHRTSVCVRVCVSVCVCVCARTHMFRVASYRVLSYN